MAKSKKIKFYAVRVGRRPGVYREWNGENGAEAQIKRISRYYDLQPRGWESFDTWQQADEYLRTNELYTVESSIDDRQRVAYNEGMSRIEDHSTRLPPQLAQPSKEDDLSAEETVAPDIPSVPYDYDAGLETFLREYYPDRTFTDDQKAAIQAVKGAHLLYAIPGSGKTAVLTARAGYMIHLGMPAEKMLIMTFGKKAAEHMGDVFHERFPDFDLPTFCTIHSFCNKVLTKAADSHRFVRHKLICDEEDDPIPDAMDPDAREAWIVDESADETPSASTKREDDEKGNRYANSQSPIYLLERILTRLGCFKKQAEARQTAEQAAIAISCIKNRMMSDAEVKALSLMDLGADEPVDIWGVYSAYQAELEEHDPPEMDFDDMLILASRVFEDCDQLAYWQRKYPYISIDEAQDTSPLQHAIIRALYADRSDGTLFMVGDDDQSIYAFRGATPKTMLRFDRDYANACIHRMGTNFRSDRVIVQTGDKLIKRNTERAPKDMAAYSTVPGDIRIIDISAAAQGEFLLHQAMEFIEEQNQRDKPRRETMAILYRNNLSALLPLAYFFKYDIPFSSNKVFDIISILYSRTAINLLSVLNYAMSPADMRCYKSAYCAWNCYKGLYLKKEEAVDRLVGKVGKDGNGEALLPQLQQLLALGGDEVRAWHIGEVWQHLNRIREENNPSNAIMTVLSDLEYRANRSVRQKNVRLLIAALIRIAALYKDIPAFLNAMAELRAKKKWDSHNDQKTAYVTLSTMHSAKGQEYDHVIIIDALESIMPGDPEKPLPFWFDSWRHHVEEERRLFYVAATRAKHDLRIVVNGLHQSGPDEPSRYTDEVLRDYPDMTIENLAAYPGCAIRDGEMEKALGIVYYAARESANPGIFTDYEEAGIRGFCNPVYKKCNTRSEALSFLNKSIPCSMIPPDLLHCPDLPAPVETSLLDLFHVTELNGLSAETIKDIYEKTRWMFAKDEASAEPADYSLCAGDYALQYLPVNLHKIWLPLNELLCDARLPILDEYVYPDGQRPIRILEMGVGPGTATLGLLSFYAMVAEENPSIRISVEYTPIEYEPAFKPIFDTLIAEMLANLPANLHVDMKPLQIRDAFAFLRSIPSPCYDLIVESNMLNPNEHADPRNIGGLVQDIHRALLYSGKAILIEPADNKTAALLRNAADLAADRGGFAVMGPRKDANDVSGVKLYHDACACGLRNPLEDDKHWFSYTVLTKTKGCGFS